MLILDRVSRIHGTGPATVHALTKVDLEVRPGELVAVMGPSGSGKSTLLNLAGALDRPTAGRVLVDGEDTTTMSPAALARLRRRRIGFVFQDYNLISSLTATENVALPLSLDGMGTRRAHKLASEALAGVELDDVGPRFPDQLSGGQRQRVAIARALVGDRRLVLADEPTGALDSVTGEIVLRLLKQRCDDGAAGLLVTHDARHAAWADRIVTLRDGRIVGVTSADTDPSTLLAEIPA